MNISRISFQTRSFGAKMNYAISQDTPSYAWLEMHPEEEAKMMQAQREEKEREEAKKLATARKYAGLPTDKEIPNPKIVDKFCKNSSAINREILNDSIDKLSEKYGDDSHVVRALAAIRVELNRLNLRSNKLELFQTRG